MSPKSRPESNKVYIRRLKEWVEVDDEVYRAYQNPIDAHRHRMQYDAKRERVRKDGGDVESIPPERSMCRCVCPKSRIWVCDGDCGLCEYQRAGGTVYLDAPVDGGTTPRGHFWKDESVDIAAIVEDSMLLGELFEKLKHLDPEYARICEMLLDGYTEREIASALGYKNQSSINHRKKRIASLIRDEFSEYFDIF